MGEPNPLIDVCRLVAAGVVGGLIATFTGHRLTISRERNVGKKSRRRDFLAFMRTWRKDAERMVLRYDAIYHFPAWFNETIPSFCGCAETIRSDFTGKNRKRFETLTDTISNSNWKDGGNPDKYKDWLKKVDEIIAFADAVKN